MSRKNIIQGVSILAIIGLAVISTSFLLSSKKEVPHIKQEEKLVSLRVQEVRYEAKHFDLEYTGRVMSSKEVAVSAQVSGELKQGDINFKKGESFRKGTVLLRVNDDQQQAALMSSRSSFLTSLSQLLPDIEIDFPNEFSKWETFFNAISLNKKMPALPKINSEKERVFMAANNILTSYYNINQQEITLDRHIIRAPFDGAIYSVNSEVGAIANPGSVLGTLIRTDALEVEVPVKPEDRNSITIGQKCYIVKGSTDILEGKIARISPFLDKQTQMESVFVSVKSKQVLLEGEYLKVNFPTEAEQKAIVLPREALTADNEVFLVRNEHLFAQKAKVLQLLPDSVVLAGVPEGEFVVTESLINLKAGDRVNVLMGR